VRGVEGAVRSGLVANVEVGLALGGVMGLALSQFWIEVYNILAEIIPACHSRLNRER